jgi:hemolysin activation/secretion protein
MTGAFGRPALATLLTTAVGAVLAQQQVPDAGQLLQETRPAPSLPLREAPKIGIEEAPSPAAPDGLRIHVARLRITGATLFAEPELHALVADAEGKELSLGELRGLAERVTRYYRSRGYLLARAYLPAQEVVDGEVQLAVLEGRLGEVRVDNTAGAGGAALAPLDWLRSGEATRSDALERNLLLLSDLPGVEVKSTLKPGATLGASDLLVEVAEGRRITGSFDFDNFGNRFSGEYRAGGTLNFNNPMRLGDQATLRALVSDERMTYLRGSYQLPVNGRGTRLGIAVSDMRYRLGKDLAPLQAEGDARSASLYAMHPFIRSRTFNLNAQVQYDRLKLQDRIKAAATVVDKTLDNWNIGITGDFQDRFGGINGFSATYTAGDLELDPVSRRLDAATAGSGGSFGKSNLTWLRLQRLGDLASVYLSGTAQFASKNLDSSQKLALGGANAVRAYPQNEAPGDEGYVATVEVRRNLPTALAGAWQVSAFVDTGHVTFNKSAWTAGANSRTLSGAGIGLTAALPRDWYFKAGLAWKLGSQRAISEVDRSPRVWLQAGSSL